jgi:predicted nucleotidyltransferase
MPDFEFAILPCSGYICIMNKKEINITQMIKARIKQKNPLADIILFGSHARGKSHKDSDWDILILLNQPTVSRLTEKEYRDELFDVELEIGEPISTFVFSKSDWEQKHEITPLYQNIKREGIYL